MMSSRSSWRSVLKTPKRQHFSLRTREDAWVYNFGRQEVRANMRSMIDVYETQRVAFVTQDPKAALLVDAFVDEDPTKISWNRGLKADLGRGRQHGFRDAATTVGTYRPFTKEHVYFDRAMNDMIYQLPRMFPTSNHPNYGFYLNGVHATPIFAALMMDQIPCLDVYGKGGQFFSRYAYEPVEDDGALFDAAEGEVVDGYRRVDNITDEALARFRAAYGPSITKDDVFFHVYGLLHSPDYRTRFASDLKKMLPRIPLVANAIAFIDAGRALSELHLGYESAKPYPLDGLPGPSGEGPADASDAAYQQFRVEKMRFGKPTAEQKQAGLRDDRTTIVYNDRITVGGVPGEAYRYLLGSRSAVEWIMERYQVKVDKASQIRNDPNDWSREVGDPRYIIDLLARIVTVSLETMTIVDALPALEVLPTEGKT
jgi:predicted helicase